MHLYIAPFDNRLPRLTNSSFMTICDGVRSSCSIRNGVPLIARGLSRCQIFALQARLSQIDLSCSSIITHGTSAMTASPASTNQHRPVWGPTVPCRYVLGHRIRTVAPCRYRLGNAFPNRSPRRYQVGKNRGGFGKYQKPLKYDADSY